MSCHVCEAVASPARERIVLDDGTWCAYQVAEVPGWITLATKAHVEGPHALSAEQSTTLGWHIQRLASAIRAAVDDERTHVVYLGEAARHFHLGFFPRSADQEPLLSNDRVLAELSSRADAARASAVVAAIRRALTAT
jgi:diadenosine tetraphosphate (Ap4A) HIT family hydrolase